MKRIIVSVFVLCSIIGLISASSQAETAAAATQSSALTEVQKTIDDVVSISQTLAGKERTKERRAKLREVIDPRFDFAEMSKRSLGANWTQLNPEQQKAFTDTFSELLARTYLAKIETVKPGMVKMDGEKLDFPRSLIRTLVTSKGDVFPIEYRMYNQDGNWRVYDVVIENIGLVANYRNEFAGIMRKDGFDGLLQKLKDKNEAAEKAT